MLITRLHYTYVYLHNSKQRQYACMYNTIICTRIVTSGLTMRAGRPLGQRWSGGHEIIIREHTVWTDTCCFYFSPRGIDTKRPLDKRISDSNWRNKQSTLHTLNVCRWRTRTVWARVASERRAMLSPLSLKAKHKTIDIRIRTRK